MGGPVYWQDGSAVGAFSSPPTAHSVSRLSRVMHADLLDSMHAFNQSLQYDQRMHGADIRGSIAYAKALTRVGILTGEEENKIVEGLQAVRREWEMEQVRCSGRL